MTHSDPSERIVAIGLLTQRDVEVLGLSFRRLFPISDTPAFEDLLQRLNAIDADERPR